MSNTLRLFFLATVCSILSVGCNSNSGTTSEGTGSVTKANVLKVTDGMSIDDAKLILGPPTHHAEVLHIGRDRHSSGRFGRV